MSHEMLAKVYGTSEREAASWVNGIPEGDSQAISKLLDEYAKLAKLGRGYTDAQVDALFLRIRSRLPTLRRRWNRDLGFWRFCPADYGDKSASTAVVSGFLAALKKLAAQFDIAQTRLDKVLAIDAFMHAQHETGPFLTAAFSCSNAEFGADVNKALDLLFKGQANPVPERPSANYVAFMQEHATDKHHREYNAMWKALREYEALAKQGKMYPTSRVDALYEELKTRFLRTYDKRWLEFHNGEYPLEDLEGVPYKLRKMFMRVNRQRIDKVIAIDALMHEQHADGLVFVVMYEPSPDIYQLAENNDVDQFLEKLFVQKNPSVKWVITREHGRIVRSYDGITHKYAVRNGTADGGKPSYYISVLAKRGCGPTNYWRRYQIVKTLSEVNTIVSKLETVKPHWPGETRNPLYHGGRNLGSTGTLKFGQQGRPNSGVDAGAIFVTPTKKYAKQYVQPGGKLYMATADLAKERIFDATKPEDLRRLEALTNRETIRCITETVRCGAADWATLSQFTEELQEAGFTGAKFLEREHLNITPMPNGQSFKVSGPPVYSYGFFHEVPVREAKNPLPAVSVAYVKFSKIYKLISKSNEAYAIARDFGWCDGGCWMLAAAVKPLCPGSHLIAVISADSMYMQHVALEWGGWYLDGTGVRTRESFLKYWRYDRCDGLGKGTEAVPFDPKLVPVDEARPFYKRATKLREFLVRNGI